QAFGWSAALAFGVGAALVLATRSDSHKVTRRSGYLVTVSAWLVVTAFGALPLYLSTLHLSYTDAFFETMSGLTTTGSTVIVGLDQAPPGLLLWRSLLQWFGGVGIVVMALAMLPVLRTGGMQLFLTESSDISGKPFSRTRQIASLTILAYVTLSVACAIGYWLAGMNVFDAINHAMTTLATGGYSTKDASLAYYNSVPIELVGILFMVAGALPLIWYPRVILQPGLRQRPEGRQIPAFLVVWVIAIALATLWNFQTDGMSFLHALRVSSFNVTSVLTDTGFVTSDFASWGSFAIGLFFVLYLIGGCAGSTAGGIKTFRWQLIRSGITQHLKQMVQPQRALTIRYGPEAVSEEAVHAVRNFFVLYLLTLLVLSLMVMATGIDFLSSTSAVAQAMANAGPGLGQLGGPAGNFAGFPSSAKWIICAAMLLGRLELSTVYVLLIPDYWLP
ncbi:MAG TPA: TrkH family potassium uptake protein, partial [Gammaproteobacteria bacterium]|nr:TrkH family potassium uptake protein [Gammaproteobacteria bacterium]